MMFPPFLTEIYVNTAADTALFNIYERNSVSLTDLKWTIHRPRSLPVLADAVQE
jgi:hypothetical protein